MLVFVARVLPHPPHNEDEKEHEERRKDEHEYRKKTCDCLERGDQGGIRVSSYFFCLLGRKTT